MDRQRRLDTGDVAARRRARPEREDRLVEARDRRLARRREKGGDLTGPSPVNRGFPSTKYHLAVDANGWPVAVRIGPGNENERAHLLPLIDTVTDAGYQPLEAWADRGYCSDPLREEIEERGIAAKISRRNHKGQPLQPGQTSRTGTRGRKPVTRSSDPQARHRWVVERTTAWLRRFKRLTIRTEPNSNVYLAYLTLALTIILARAL